MKTALIAIGGNSLIRAGERGTIEEQAANALRTTRSIVDVIRSGYSVVLTHGNGPQVGAALLRSECASDQVYGHPLDVCVASTQGEIGYLLQRSMEMSVKEAGFTIPVITILTQVLVDERDPAFRRPTKPIGPFYSWNEALAKKELFGWEIVEDAARGYRRVVASPEPRSIVEKEAIGKCVNQGMIVIALGGGGIPVVERDATIAGVDAVIDKDRASALLASELDVNLFIMSTDIDYVYLHFRSPSREPVRRATAATMEEYLKRGEFPAGSMGPKIESALQYLRNGGREVIITSPERLHDAVRGEAGTHILPDDAA